MRGMLENCVGDFKPLGHYCDLVPYQLCANMLSDFSMSQFFNDTKWVDILTQQRMLWVYVALAFLLVMYLVIRIRRVENGQKSYRGGWQKRHDDRQQQTNFTNVKPFKTFDSNLVGFGDARHAANQLEFISRVEFETVRLLNKDEYPLLLLLEKLLYDAGKGHRVMAQTSLGEILRPKQTLGSREDQTNAYSSINSKRLDFAIIDRTGMLALAVEFQGSGHYSNKAFIRDAVKREALRKANVQMLEVPAQFEVETVRKQVLKALGMDLAAVRR